MRKGRLERLFARYQRRGDLAALAEVFDRTAGDLLRLAHHLSRHPVDAEDLLQDTFVTAIERAASWDDGRPLLPWLTGILARKASSSRRHDARQLETERLARTSEDDPSAAALARELTSEVSRALACFEADERALLLPYLRGERAPIDIARELGLAPGTVRMRIHRGIERLRQLLPAGVGAGLLGMAVAPRGLAAIRRAVLAHASHVSLAAPAVTLSTGTTLGFTLAMTKTTTLLGSIAGALVIAGALYWAHGSPSLAVTAPTAEGSRVESAGALPTDHPLETSAARAAAPVEEREEESGERRAIQTRSLRIEGRILGVDREQLAGVRVSIVRSAVEWMAALNSGQDGCQRNNPLSSCTTCHDAQSAEWQTLVVNDLAELINTRVDNTANLGRVKLNRENSGTEVQSDAGPGGQIREVGVDEEGRFSIDLTSQFSDEEVTLPEAFEVSADHECYFAKRTLIPFSDSDKQRFRDRESVVLSAELALAPAAVVRGTVLQSKPSEPLQIDLEELASEVFILNDSAPEASAQMSFEITLSSGELSSGSFSLRFINNFHSTPSITIALFALENGEPLPAPIAQTAVNEGDPFELEIAQEGKFLLAAVEQGKRPRTFRVDMRLREITEVEPFALDGGAALQGRLVSAGEDPSQSWVVARRREASGDRPIDFPGQDIVWSDGAFEWRSVTGSVDEEGSFRVEGLAPDFYGLAPGVSSELDLASAAAAQACTGAPCLAPSSGIVLAPDHARLEVKLTRHGSILDELPAREPVVDPNAGEDAPSVPPPPILLRVRMLDGETTGEFAFEDRTRALVLVEPSRRTRCELWVGDELRDSIELLAPPAGSGDSVLLELGDF
jgi:RNA polymerase sigma-70 factor (ECF subfamily)